MDLRRLEAENAELRRQAVDLALAVHGLNETRRRAREISRARCHNEDQTTSGTFRQRS